MKKLFTIALVAFVSTTAYSQAVPNGGFEAVTGANADGWNQTLGKVEAMSELSISSNGVPGTASPHSGKYGLLVQNTKQVGIATSNSFAISSRPKSLRFNAVYFPRQNGEAFAAFVIFTKWNTTTSARDTIYNLGLQLNAGIIYPWTDVTISIMDTAWKSTDTPDSAVISIRAGATNKAAEGTLLWVDNVVFRDWALSSNKLEITTLSQASVYPSPATANGTTKLTYTLHTNSKVSIQLIDISGKVVKEILNEEQTYGEKEINVSLGDLASGVYFYNIKTDKTTKAVKFIVE